MKCSETWLHEWVNTSLNRNDLCNALTMAGLEVEELAPVAAEFNDVVIGEVLNVVKHPEADRLNLCDVNIGTNEPLKIVCGAPNVRKGMKAPLAQIGAVLPDKTVIKAAKIRGVASQGMLCSAVELGMSQDHDGLLELPVDAPVGKALRNYLLLDDFTIDVSITPNRGDCLSVRGLAREVSAITQSTFIPLSIPVVTATCKDEITVKSQAKNDCPHYVGRVIRNVKADAMTPIWIKERLQRSDVRSINPVVDVTNYVMLELGQPMHAFDLSKIQQEIIVRHSHAGEKISLLDGSEQVLDDKTLLIADHKNPLAIAGVMGGMDSGVTLLTKDIFLESAFFTPTIVARQRQHYGLNSDSAYRFERGVDPTIQREAIERATQLILEISGGEAGPVIEVTSKQDLPDSKVISLHASKIAQILGVAISDQEVELIFQSLAMTFKKIKNGWQVHVPAYRFDLSLPEDLIEEIARLYGYDKIPTREIVASLQANRHEQRDQKWQLARQGLADQGFHEIISYSFVEEKLQNLLDPSSVKLNLLNPITAEMSVMRTSLWPGLINTLVYNKSRQQQRVRLFEVGMCFSQHDSLMQENKIAGLISGLATQEQWGAASREVDFYDLKGHIENVLRLFCTPHDVTFKHENHPALHPGQSAGIYYRNKKIGVIGGLHPSLLQTLDVSGKVFVFEMDLIPVFSTGLPLYHEISKFPEIRRDIAIIVKQTVPAKDIQDRIKYVAGDWLKDVFIFDVYQGKGISPGLKSIALALVWQHPTRTLVDDEVATLMQRVVTELTGQLGAELRS